MPPQHDRSTLSVKNCRINLDRPAPSAARIATSRARSTLRASVRLARLAQAIRQDHPHRCQQDIQRLTHGLTDEHVRKTVYGNAPALVGIGVIVGDSAADCVHLRVRLFQCDAGFQAGVGAEPVKITGHVLRFKSERPPNLIEGTVKRAPFREHADNQMRLAIQQHFAADDTRIRTKLCSPELIAQHRDKILAGFIFARSKRAAKRNRSAEDVEEFRRHSSSTDLYRRA
jgi:hypothetical protein